MSHAFFSKLVSFFAIAILRGSKLRVVCQKIVKHCLTRELFGFIFLSLATFLSPNLSQARNPTLKVFFWTKLGGHLGSEPQFGNSRLTNCLAHVFQNPDSNVNFSYTSPRNQRHANESPGNPICFKCFYMFY